MFDIYDTRSGCLWRDTRDSQWERASVTHRMVRASIAETWLPQTCRESREHLLSRDQAISRAGAGCSGERRPTLGGRLAGPGPTGLAGPRLWGGGPLGLRAQGPVRSGVVDCRWSLRACRHGTLGRLHCGCRRSRLRALLCPFLGGGRGCPCGGSPGGPVPWGSLDVWGPGLFRACFMPCGMGLLFPTHTIKHLHGGTLWTQARSHTQVYTQAFTLV